MQVTEKNIKGPTGELIVFNFGSSTPIDLSNCLQRRGERGGIRITTDTLKKKTLILL